jgi:hypothetical protein
VSSELALRAEGADYIGIMWRSSVPEWRNW